MTPGPLWEEHRDGAIRDGLAPEGHDTLRGGHRSYAGARGATNHPGRKPGQVTGVDRDGTPMWPAGEGGGVTKRHLLVATLPYSRHGYVEATPGMRQSAWPVCHARAWDFFGGVAAGTARDNPETGVASHPRGGGVAPDEAHGALGTHHVTAIMPTGVRRPRQRAGVEGTCGKVAASIAARLRNRAFRTLAGPDDATREALGAPRPCPPPGGAREVARRRPGRPGARSWHRCRRCRPGCAGGPADARWLPAPMSRLGATTTPFPTRASARGQISERATPLSRSGLPEGALPPIPGSGRMGGGPAAPVPRTCHRSSRMPSGTTPGCLAGPGRPGRTRTPWHRASSPTRG